MISLTRNYYPATPRRSSSRKLRARLREALGLDEDGGPR